jgi:hypothetical protein
VDEHHGRSGTETLPFDDGGCGTMKKLIPDCSVNLLWQSERLEQE